VRGGAIRPQRGNVQLEFGLELLAEAAVIAAFAWQVARIAAKPVAQRMLRERRGAVVAGLALGLPALALLAWGARESALLRRATVASLAIGIALAAWRARPAYGASKGLPPGSLGFGRSLDAIDDRGFYQAEAARHGPVFKTSQFGRPVLCIVGLDRGRELLLQHGQHLEGASLPYTRLIPKGALRFMRADEHRQVSGLFRPSIAATDLAAAEAAARHVFRGELLRLADESAARAGAGVRVSGAIESALFACLARILFGLEPGRPEIEEIRAWIGGVDFSSSGGRSWRRRLEAALDAVSEILRRATRDASAPIVPSSSLGRILAAEPDALEDRTVAGNLILIFRISNVDMAGLIDWILKMLSDNPAWPSRMRAEGRTAGAPPRPLDLGTRIVMETLRLEQSEYLYRKVAQDFEFGGYRIPKGWLIRICVQESHRNPDIFADPTRFDPDRFAARAFARSEYAPLGVDAHGCMGTAIIHFLGRIFVEELTLGFDWEVVSDGPLERGTRHWRHWHPSSRFRVALRRRAGEARAVVPTPRSN
jgi:cytochrome P450